MTYFRKPKKGAALPVPAICIRCRFRPGTIPCVQMDRTDSSGAVPGSTDVWWLCSECAESTQPDDPTLS